MIKLSGSGSLYRQLYEGIRHNIINGDYEAGSKLPSSRELAKTLGISRNTVISCYEQLNAEGYIEVKAGAGSFVAKDVANNAAGKVTALKAQQTEARQQSQHCRQQRPPQLSQTAQNALQHWRGYYANQTQPTELAYDFRYGPVTVSDELLADINRVARKCRRVIIGDYQTPSGLLSLRENIAHYVRHNRGCHCEAANIVMTNGSQQALDILARLLLEPADAVIIEDPAYRGATQAFSNAGARMIRSAVDEKGLKPSLFAQQAARLVYTTPSHQFPTGGVLPRARRLQLLAWAQRHHAYIIEDDYDSEFRYQGAPIESIQGLDGNGQTIYIGTFSKILSPSLRVGYVVLPEPLVEPFTALKWCADRQSPLLNQLILAEFMDSPQFGRHLKRARKLYSKRHDVLIHALQQHFGDEIRIQGTNAGIHLLAWFNQLKPSDEAALVAAANAASVGIYTPTNLFATPPQQLGLLMGYGNLPSTKIAQGVARLAACYQAIKQQKGVV